MQWHRISRMVAASIGLMFLSAAADAQEMIDCPTAMPSGGPPATASFQMLNDVCYLDRFPPSGLPILLFDDSPGAASSRWLGRRKMASAACPPAGLRLEAQQIAQR